MARNTIKPAQKLALASHLKTLMGQKGLTTRDLMRETGINYVSIYNYVHARNFPDLGNMTKLATALGVEVETLAAFGKVASKVSGRSVAKVNAVKIVRETPLALGLRGLMEQAGLSQGELAIKAKLPQKTVSEYMRGEVAAPGDANRRKLAEGLGVDLAVIERMSASPTAPVQKPTTASSAPAFDASPIMVTETVQAITVMVRQNGDVAEVVMRNLPTNDVWSLVRSLADNGRAVSVVAA